MINIREEKLSEKISVFYLENSKEVELKLTNYGATLISMIVKDSKGNKRDIVLGYDDIEEYKSGDKFFGATIGRFGNRIARGEFKLNDKTYVLAKNDKTNHLHGGYEGFHKKIWNYEIIDKGIRFKYTSVNGEEGYPGELSIIVDYSLSDQNELIIEYYAKSDEDTIINPTNHSYFNLDGHSNEMSILDHNLKLYSSYFTPVDDTFIPTGQIKSLKASPMNFIEFKKIKDVFKPYNEQIQLAKGIDHNYFIDNYNEKLNLAAIIQSTLKDLKLEVYTTLPGMQVYTGNNIDLALGKNQIEYKNHSAICIETQYFPDSINYENFISPILRKDEEYKSTTIYKIIVE